jgi:hypothetical protein
MRTFLAWLLILSLSIQPALADPTPDDPKMDEEIKNNVTDFRDWMMKELAQFPKPDPSRGYHSMGMAAIGKKNSVFTASQYNQAAKSDWVKCQVMQGLSLLSQQLSTTVGTALAPQSSTQLQQYATQLQQSDDPQFQQIGTLYTQEAQAIQSGNVQATDSAASQVAAVTPPTVASGYQPSSDESSLAQAFTTILSMVMMAYGGVLGAAFVSQLTQAMNGNTSSSSLMGTGASLGNMISAGQNPGATASSSVPTTIQNSGAVMQQLGTVNVQPRQSQNSANAGSAPQAQ